MKELTFITMVVLSLTVLFAQKKEHNEFTVLAEKDAFIYGKKIATLQKLDDVTKIEIKDGGYVALVDAYGFTYELKESTYTLDLKAEGIAPTNLPDLKFMYADKKQEDDKVFLLYPRADEKLQLQVVHKSVIDFYWNKHKDLYGSQTIHAFTSSGNKIQDFKTTKHTYGIKPAGLGIDDGFTFRISYKDYDMREYSSEQYTVNLVKDNSYQMKAADYVIKALCMESLPKVALDVWQKALNMANGKFYSKLYTKFLDRNKDVLVELGADTTALIKD